MILMFNDDFFVWLNRIAIYLFVFYDMLNIIKMNANTYIYKYIYIYLFIYIYRRF